MTKGMPYSVFLAELTHGLLQRPPDDLVYVDEFEVRGRQGEAEVVGARRDEAGGRPGGCSRYGSLNANSPSLR